MRWRRCGYWISKVRSSAETLEMLSDSASAFEERYGKMIDQVLNLNLPTTVCTIYYPRFEDALRQMVARDPLASFNDVIIRQAFRAALPLIDLRLLCNEDADYANPIEPSEAGGLKIVQTIMKIVNVHDFANDGGRTVVYFYMEATPRSGSSSSVKLEPQGDHDFGVATC